MDSNGYIKLYRCLLEHPIWKTSTAEQKVILITLLEMANHAPAKWVWKGKEFEVDRGQMITSIPEIKRAAGKDISDMNVRTALKKFEKVFEFLTDESTHTGRLITIVNYSKWQDLEDSTNRQTNRQLTDSQQTANRQLTANKNNKKNKKNKNNIYKPPIVPLTELTEGMSEPLREIAEEWFAYKAERKESYKPQGAKAWVATLKGIAEQYSDKQICDVIRRSMAANYQGVVWDWLKKAPKQEEGRLDWIDRIDWNN